MVQTVGNVTHFSLVNTRGGSQEKNPEWRPPGQEYLINNLKENYEYIPVNYRGCVDSGWVVNCCGYSVLVTNKTPVLNVIRVGQPDYTTMHSSHIVLLPMPQFSLAIHCIHVLPAMKNRFLMSVEKLCDGGFSVNFDAKHVYLQKRA